MSEARNVRVTSICGVCSPSGNILCSLEPGHYMYPGMRRHSWEQGVGTVQPSPIANDGPSMHDLVISDILSRDPRWDLSVGRARHLRDQVANDLLVRKNFGLEKYGTTLQARNGRDAVQDLYEELQDAAVYARQRLCEVSEDNLAWPYLYQIYDDIVTHLVTLRRLRNAATE